MIIEGEGELTTNSLHVLHFIQEGHEFQDLGNVRGWGEYPELPFRLLHIEIGTILVHCQILEISVQVSERQFLYKMGAKMIGVNIILNCLLGHFSLTWVPLSLL